MQNCPTYKYDDSKQSPARIFKVINGLGYLQLWVSLTYPNLVTRWKVVGDDDGIQYVPFPVPKQGLPMKVIPKNKKVTT